MLMCWTLSFPPNILYLLLPRSMHLRCGGNNKCNRCGYYELGEQYGDETHIDYASRYCHPKTTLVSVKIRDDEHQADGDADNPETYAQYHLSPLCKVSRRLGCT